MDTMGHGCRICGRKLPNEKFSGRGHTVHVCRECAASGNDKRDEIEKEKEIFGYLSQSHISDKNVDRLKEIFLSSNPYIRNLAAVVLEVAAVKPYKKRRLKILARHHPEVLSKLEETGLIFAHHMD